MSDVNFAAEMDRLNTKFKSNTTCNSLEVGVDSRCTDGEGREEVNGKEAQEAKQHCDVYMGEEEKVGTGEEEKVGTGEQEVDVDSQCTVVEGMEETNGKEAQAANQHCDDMAGQQSEVSRREEEVGGEKLEEEKKEEQSQQEEHRACIYYDSTAGSKPTRDDVS